MPNEINLFGPIGKTADGTGITAQQVKTQLAAMNQTQPLLVHIDSEGGSVFDGLSLYEAFASYSGPKEAIIESTAFSMASYIAMAFDRVTIAENGYVMVHQPSTDTGGTASELVSTADVLTKLDQSMTAAYVRKSGLSEARVKQMMAAETFLNANEALAVGFVDAIAKRNVPTRIQPSARHKTMPQRVYAALFGAGSGGDTELHKDKPMSTQTIVAATVQEIKAAFPKAKSDFIVRCLEKGLPIASVASAAADEMMKENEEMSAKVTSLEAELAAMKASAAKADDTDTDDTDDDKSDVEAKKVAAKNGVKAVAKAKEVTKRTAVTEWNTAIDEQLKLHAGNRLKAVSAVNKRHPGLRERMVAEANAR